MTESTDPYTYPATSVLRNLRGIRDPLILARYEAESSTRRITELIDAPVPGWFDTVHLKAIHKHIFQDVYSWAGEFRTVNISKGGQLFGVAAFVELPYETSFNRFPARIISRNVIWNRSPHVRVITWVRSMPCTLSETETGALSENSFEIWAQGGLRDRLEPGHAGSDDSGIPRQL